MANSTLDVMHDIEAVAKSVLAEYDDKIRSLQLQAQSQLDDVAKAYDDETDKQVANLTEIGQKRLQDLKAQLDITIQENDAKVRHALTDKKDDLVQQIVDKVVERYGN